jgi:hypothetical protein
VNWADALCPVVWSNPEIVTVVVPGVNPLQVTVAVVTVALRVAGLTAQRVALLVRSMLSVEPAVRLTVAVRLPVPPAGTDKAAAESVTEKAPPPVPVVKELGAVFLQATVLAVRLSNAARTRSGLVIVGHLRVARWIAASTSGAMTA